MTEIDEVHVLAYTLMTLLQKRHDPCSIHDQAEACIMHLLLERISELKLPERMR